jgi:general stress protein 26
VGDDVDGKANIEEKIRKSLETVDVGLVKDDMRVAVEISSTSKAQQEVANIRKCLEAGYDYVLSVSADEPGLAVLKREARKHFVAGERDRVRFYLP